MVGWWWCGGGGGGCGGGCGCGWVWWGEGGEEVAKLIVGNDSGMCKASFAGDVPRMLSLMKNSFCV